MVVVGERQGRGVDDALRGGFDRDSCVVRRLDLLLLGRLGGHQERLESLADLSNSLIDGELAEESREDDLALDTTDRCRDLIQQRGHESLRS